MISDSRLKIVDWRKGAFVALLLLCAVPALAMFEENESGVRAEGMGSAFTAVADDASAVDFNPAGLFQVEAAQAQIFGKLLYGGAGSGLYTGAQVREMLEVSINGHHAIFQLSGVKMTYAKKNPIGQRVLSVTVSGEPLDTAKVYKVVTNSYLAAGSGEYGVFTRGEDLEDSFLPLRDVMAAYIKRHSPVDARIEGRIVAVDK